MSDISKSIHVRKASGELEVFDTGKLKESLRRAGGSEEIIENITIKFKG